LTFDYSPMPRILAHRGASAAAPENTLEAFRTAVQMGADGVELDVHATADQVILIHHDPILPGVGPIAEHTAAECRAAPGPGGAPVPTLGGALEVWVEVKALPDSADAALLAALDCGPAPRRYAVHSFDHRIVARLGRLRPTLRRGCLLVARLLAPVAAVQAAGATALWQEASAVDASLVRQAHDAGIEVIVWTVNDAAAAVALAALGVDALCGDAPDLLRSALAAALPHRH
jgi:glycerophosphoryl diester phosphodiesterase